MGLKTLQGYGLTETSPVVSCNPVNKIKIDTVGIIFSNNEVKIADDGEILVKGENIMLGYWNMKKETEEVIRNGWLHTGDAGRMDEDGYVYIEDRIKDMIVSAGENIYSIEVESALMEHPEITDAAVIGIPDEKFGEAVKAFIVTKDGKELPQEDVIEFCKSKIASYKTPKTVDLIEIIPRNPSGKILKKVLREPFWAGKDRQVG